MAKRVLPVLLLCLLALPLSAYVGPGAGFAFVGSFLFIVAAFFLALFNFLTFPFRALLRLLKRRHTLRRSRFRRVILVGFDGMDYRLYRQFRQAGQRFPRFEKLEKEGSFAPLWSSEPPISPVAWSTLATGVNPGKHNIFDFLATDRQTYMPKLACSEILPPRRQLRFGRWQVPLSSPRIELKRKSQSFWKIVGSKGIYAAVLRMPFTFPPEKLYGVMLAGLGTPDLRGTQGSFTFFSDQPLQQVDISDGLCEQLEPLGPGGFRGTIKGPPHPFRSDEALLKISFTLEPDSQAQTALVRVGGETLRLELNRLSPWMHLTFKAGLLSISGIAQWVLGSLEPLRLYLSPIHLDPEKPAMPISQPKIFSVYLAKLLGPYATLGMAEDTWSLNERVLSERNFLDQVYQTQREREAIFFNTLKKVKSGLIVQVFETTDRVQHMFWRYLPQSGSPAEKPSSEKEIVNAILESYRAMDQFLAKLFPLLRGNDLLLIVSDHGFGPFNRGFHLNSWLRREGYLALREGKSASGKWYADVDWSDPEPMARV